jgi:hypothetical protein
MTLKVHKKHKNLIAGGVAAIGISCWRPDDFMCFGLINPDTLAASNMPGEAHRGTVQQSISIERLLSAYHFRHQ